MEKTIDTNRRQQEFENLSEIKKAKFWKWLRMSEHKEAGHSFNLDKAIPGFASVIAVILFFIKEFIVHESEEGLLFNDLNFTIGLQILNAIILVIILSRGLRVIELNAASEALKKINYNYIHALEGQFIKFIRYFFTLTLCLYIVFITNTVSSGFVNQQSYREHFNQIVAGRNEIQSAADSIRTDIERARVIPANYAELNENFNSIDKNLLYLIYHDNGRRRLETGTFTHLQRIKQINDSVGEYINEIDGSIKSPQFEGLIKDMYQGHHKIEQNSKYLDGQKTKALIIDFLELLSSNLGALFIVYSFLVLYTKTIEWDENEQFKKSLLKLKNIFGDNETVTVNTNRYLIGFLFAITIFQWIVELIYQDNLGAISIFFTMFSGLCNALALSLLVARFESPLFNSTFSVLVILYLYANIQIMFGLFNIPLFNYPHLVEDLTILIAFLGKCFLYLYVLWIVRTDRLKYYFYHKYDNSTATKSKMEWDQFVAYTTKIETDKYADQNISDKDSSTELQEVIKRSFYEE